MSWLNRPAVEALRATQFWRLDHYTHRAEQVDASLKRYGDQNDAWSIPIAGTRLSTFWPRSGLGGEFGD